MELNVDIDMISLDTKGTVSGYQRSPRKGSFSEESDVGSTEYKRHLLTEDFSRIEHLITQLAYRLNETSDSSEVGKCQYRIGVEDTGLFSHLTLDDLEKSIARLEMMAASISAKVSEIVKTSYKSEVDGKEYYHALITIEKFGDTAKTDIRIAVCGNVDAGKSTCIGCLKSGQLDDGRGKSRTLTMVHQHEISSGRTSTVSSHVLGYKGNGELANYDTRASIDMVTKNSERLVTLVDLAGHEKYLRSMIYGVSSSLLDYGLVLINSRSGVTHMTGHHLTVLGMMRIPTIILFSKVDGCPEHRYKETVAETRELLKSPDVRKRLTCINPEKEGIKTLLGFVSADRQQTIPAFPISFVEGTNLPFLKRILRFLPKRRKHENKIQHKLEFIIDRLFNVPGVGPVVLGFVNAGVVHSNTTVWWGPLSTESGDMTKVNIRTIHYNELPVRSVCAGNFACLAIKLSKDQVKLVRRGQVITEIIEKDKDGQEGKPRATRTFTAKLNIVHSQSTTISPGYTPFLHVLMVRQSAVVLTCQVLDGTTGQARFSVDERAEEMIVRPGDVALIKFRFIYRPEYVRKGMRIIFRDGKVKAVGAILELLDEVL